MLLITEASDAWLNLEETTELAEEYLAGYDPARMKIAAYTRAFAVQVTRVSPTELVSRSRETHLVDARMFWAHALWGAGYSYMQISRALHRTNHSTAFHLLTTKKFTINTRAYLMVSLNLGKKIGAKRLEWLDEFRGDLESMGTSRKIRDDYSKRRVDLMTLLDRDLEFDADSRIAPARPKPNPPTQQEIMNDLAERFRQEILHG